MPRTSFWVFSGPTAPDDPQLALTPLYRLTRDRSEFLEFCGDGVTTTHRAWGYATTAFEITAAYIPATFVDGVRYFPEGIEGYIYPTAATPPSGAEKLYRYFNEQLDDWLLLLESEDPPPGYDDGLNGPGTQPDGEWIGWVFPHVDSDLDGVIDAWETLIGTDPQEEDSDADGCTDGASIHPFLPGNTTDARYSMVEGSCSAGIGDNRCMFLTSKADEVAVPDLGLEPLAGNGGSTPTHALLVSSPALDLVPLTTCPPTDQRGVARPQDGDGDGTSLCDVGAFERSPSVVEVPALDRWGFVFLVSFLALLGVQRHRGANRRA